MKATALLEVVRPHSFFFAKIFIKFKGMQIIMNIKQQLTLPALFLACGLLLPIAFHMFGMAGKIFLPMHIPVFMAGLLLGWRKGLFIGILTPLLSSFLTGMPSLYPMAPIMSIELAVYGATAGYLHYSKGLSILPSLISSLIAGRIAVALMLALFAEALNIKLSPWIYVMTSAANGMVGIVLQIISIPPLVKKLEVYMQQVQAHN